MSPCLAKISSAGKLSTSSRCDFYLAAGQSMNERVTVLTHDQMMFIFGGENIMEPVQTFR
jgi:hypothetical protein